VGRAQLLDRPNKRPDPGAKLRPVGGGNSSLQLLSNLAERPQETLDAHGSSQGLAFAGGTGAAITPHPPSSVGIVWNMLAL